MEKKECLKEKPKVHHYVLSIEYFSKTKIKKISILINKPIKKIHIKLEKNIDQNQILINQK